jgi:hypothetical protein
LKASDIQFTNIIASDFNSSIRNTPAGNVVVFTTAQQISSFDQYIDQDKYLSTRRGQYVERNGGVLPMLHRLDLSVTQDFYIMIAGKKNSFQFRADILNFTNFVNKDWGVTQRVTNAQVLNYRTTSAANVPSFQLATQVEADGSRVLIKDSFQKNASAFDVWQAQFTLRYTFGK